MLYTSDTTNHPQIWARFGRALSTRHQQKENLTFDPKQLRMPLDKHHILQRLTEIKPQLQESYGVIDLALFGSFSRDEQTPESDIDILVRLAKPDFRALSQTAHLLYALFPERKVEVVSRGAIRPSYFAYVEPDLLYA
jgi:predicted nucleotidyltransferase